MSLDVLVRQGDTAVGSKIKPCKYGLKGINKINYSENSEISSS